MKSLSKSISVLALAVLAGCTPAKLTQPQLTSDTPETEVIVYRDGAFNAGGVQMIFGEEETDYITLRNDEWKAMQLDSGETRLFVRSNQADKPFYLETDLAPEARMCFRAYPNPSNYGKALLLNLAYFLGNTFLLEEVECPEDSVLAENITDFQTQEEVDAAVEADAEPEE